MISRIAATGRPTGTTLEKSPTTELSPEQYLRERFDADSVNPTPGALALAIAASVLERILLTTDYPWQPRAPRRGEVHANADEAQARAIFHENVPRGLHFPAPRRAGADGSTVRRARPGHHDHGNTHL